MSFLKAKEVIDEGDTVVIYLSVTNLHSIEAVPMIKNKRGELVEHVFQTSFGALKVKTIIGVKYGSKVELSKGWAYVLQPNPDLWTLTLPHRTQIIYTPDISMIIFQLELKPGSLVIESGTGSGALSHFFLRALKPNGHLYTFDFHETRADQARDEFSKHGLGDFVTVHHRDVCQQGFTSELDGKADAVFLDLPAPQLAVLHARKALKISGGRFCSFSPCIEQAQRCCEALQQHGFIEIQSMEILQCENIIKTKALPVIDLEFVKHKKPENENNITSEPESNAKQNKKSYVRPAKETRKIVTSSAPAIMPGHTGFLTFATLPPVFAR